MILVTLLHGRREFSFISRETQVDFIRMNELMVLRLLVTADAPKCGASEGLTNKTQRQADEGRVISMDVQTGRFLWRMFHTTVRLCAMVRES